MLLLRRLETGGPHCSQARVHQWHLSYALDKGKKGQRVGLLSWSESAMDPFWQVDWRRVGGQFSWGMQPTLHHARMTVSIKPYGNSITLIPLMRNKSNAWAWISALHTFCEMCLTTQSSISQYCCLFLVVSEKSQSKAIGELTIEFGKCCKPFKLNRMRHHRHI